MLLDNFILELLNLSDPSNRLVDLGDVFGKREGGSAAARDKVYLLSQKKPELNAKVMTYTAKERKGKISNRVVLSKSAKVQTLVKNPKSGEWSWHNLNGKSDAKLLDKYIEDAYTELRLRGNNPLFLSVGCLEWKTVVKQEVTTVYSPLLIYPVRLIRGSDTSDVEIEFVDDDVYFNPCLIQKLRDDVQGGFSENFPHPNGEGADFDEPIDQEKLDDASAYFEAVAAHIEKYNTDEEVFKFHPDIVAIAQYNHENMCMFYDVRRNKARINAHPLIERVFEHHDLLPEEKEEVHVDCVLPADSIQRAMTGRIVNNDNLIIKGPPGTGKTVSIANIIAALMREGKKVLMVSQKIAALTEVNNKMPESLRKFLLLLDYEKEKEAAAVNPEEIKKDLKAILNERVNYIPDRDLDSQIANNISEKSKAIKAMNEFYVDMYKGKDVVDGTYFDALNAYYKSDYPVIRFADCKDVAKVGRTDYDELYAEVKLAAKHFAEMSAQSEIHLCPWFNMGNLADSEGALKAYANIVEDVKPLLKSVEGLKEKFNIPFEKIAIGDYIKIILNDCLGKDQIGELTEKTLPKAVSDRLKKSVEKCRDNRRNPKFSFKQEGKTDMLRLLDGMNLDESLTYDEVKSINERKELFIRDGVLILGDVTVKKVIEVVAGIFESHAERKERELETAAVFGKPDEELSELILKAYEVLAPYKGTDNEPKFFDFAPKKYYKQLCAYAKKKNVTFKEITDGVCSHKAYTDISDKLIAHFNLLCTIFGREIDVDDIECLRIVITKCCGETKIPIDQYVSAVTDAYDDLKACVASCERFPSKFTVGDLHKALAGDVAYDNVTAAVKGIFDGLDNVDYLKAGELIYSLIDLKQEGVFDNIPPAEACIALDEIVALGQSFTDGFTSVADKLTAFGETYFTNIYSLNPYAVQIGMFDIFVNEATNRTILGAAIQYYAIKYGQQNAISIATFLSEFEKGTYSYKDYPIDAMFEHSFFALAIEEKHARMGGRINGHGQNQNIAIERFEETENKERELNAKKIERICMNRIKADDDDFNFLNSDKGQNKTLRTLFKNNARAILKLKKCIIASPSTVCVLFRAEEFNEFDFVIIDEASQMEPVKLLPILMRAKHCVIVGDEHQMPPIEHFKVKNKFRIDNPEDDLAIDTDISALSLALANNAFRSTELICHYRSNTEALIKYSQEAFYPNMRTFPSAIPFTDELGFVDIYVEGGFQKEGENLLEAKQAVKCLKQHFDKYYDEKKETLSRSIGIVAFGEAQLKCIIKLVSADKDLYNKLQTARSNFGDVPDKLVFFRTIESVQGQEAQELVISLTYGKNSELKTNMNFGELNRGALGKCIFNVAVTRAKSKITLIHSIRYNEFPADGATKVDYVKDYLYMVETLAKRGKNQFLSKAPSEKENFIKEVVRYVEESGVDKERIVVKYGVTDGSVKIPIAILSEDLSEAQLGIWVEHDFPCRYDFADYNVRYYRNLACRGWAMCRVYAHDWAVDKKVEQEKLAETIKKYVK